MLHISMTIQACNKYMIYNDDINYAQVTLLSKCYVRNRSKIARHFDCYFVLSSINLLLLSARYTQRSRRSRIKKKEPAYRIKCQGRRKQP